MEMMTKSILDEETHAGLIADMENISRTAGIHDRFIKTSMVGGASKAKEIEWVVNYHKNRAKGLGGLALIGLIDAEERQMEMCGALLRNFIDARVVPLNAFFNSFDKGDAPNPTVLMIPNFHIVPVGKFALPSWKVQIMYDTLMTRYASNRPTVLGIESLEHLRLGYGDAMANLIKKHYDLVEG